MKIIGFWLLLGLVLAVQIGLMPALRPFGAVPNLMLVFVVLVGLAGTASTALIAALIGGLLLDLTSGADFGLRIGLLVLAALVTGLVHRAGLTLAGPAVVMAVVAAGTVVENAAVLAGLAGSGTGWPLGFIVGKLALEVVLNLGLILMMRPLVARLIADAGTQSVN